MKPDAAPSPSPPVTDARLRELIDWYMERTGSSGSSWMPNDTLSALCELLAAREANAKLEARVAELEQVVHRALNLAQGLQP